MSKAVFRAGARKFAMFGLWLAAVVCTAPARAVVPDSSPPGSLTAAQSLLHQFFAASDAVNDYQLLMRKQQRKNGKMQPVEDIQVEHRRSPDCRYMRWVGDLHHGREMIYCANRYDGKIKVHDGGLLSLITVSLDPDGSTATKGQLHRIYESGLFAMTGMVRRDDDYIVRHPELPPPVITQRVVEGAASTCIALDRGADLFSSYHLGKQELCLDDKLMLPTELSLWNTDGVLMEHYVYSGYQLNTGLTDADFDVHNDRYHF